MDTKIYSSKMIDNLRNHLNTNKKSICSPKFIFLCGEAFKDKNNDYKSTNRGILEDFLQKNSNLFIVLSESLWENEFSTNIDLLTFEEFLAEVSDLIIMFIESPGSFCELGAFTYADKLFENKLVIVLDKKYKNDKSFIITGPIAKAKKDGSTVIYSDVINKSILSSRELRDALDERIKTFNSSKNNKNKKDPNTCQSNILLSSFIIELLELIKILQPITKKDLIDIYKKIKQFNNFNFIKGDGTKFSRTIKIDYIYKLLTSTNLIYMKDDYLYFNNEFCSNSLMFSLSNNDRNKERNKLICRKYRYKESCYNNDKKIN